MKDRLVRNTFNLLVNAGLTMGLGFLFWWLAAQWLEPAGLGVGTALVSAMMLLGVIAKLGFDVTLLRTLPSLPHAERARMLDVFMTVTVLLGAALAIAFVILAHAVGHPTRDLLADPMILAVFVVGVSATGLLVMVEGLFMSEERGALVAGKNGTVSALKVLLLVPLAVAGGAGVFGAWGLATVVVALGVLAYAGASRDWRWRPRPRFDGSVLKTSFRLNTGNFLAQTADMAPLYLLPILVAQLLGPAEAGYFYIAWMLAAVLDFVPIATTTSLLASATRAPDAATRLNRYRRASGLTALVVAPACLVAYFLGPHALGVFGAAYATEATALFQVLVLTVPFLAVNRFWIVLLRCRDQAFAFTAFSMGITLLVVALLPFAAAYGLIGVGYAWLAANAAFAVIALPGVLRELRGPVHQNAYPDAAPRPGG